MTSFSVVVTNFNYRHFVGEAIDSALAQEHPPHEIIVVDDGSTDGSADLIRDRYRGESRVSVNAQPNQGQLAAFAAGVRAATGDVIAFLDADDVWNPAYLRRIARVYEDQPAIGFVYTDLEFFGDRQGRFLKDGSSSRALGLSVLSAAYGGSGEWQASTTSAMSLRTRAARELCDIPTHYFARWRTRADDWLVYGSDVMGVRKYCLAEPLVRYRAHGANAWLGAGATPSARFEHWLKLQAMLAHFRERAGLNAESKGIALREAKREFLSQPHPTRSLLKRYLSLISAADLPWTKRLERKISMWRHYLRHRRSRGP